MNQFTTELVDALAVASTRIEVVHETIPFDNKLIYNGISKVFEPSS
ncbi:hypothetical protein [Lysinibacillus agricola]